MPDLIAASISVAFTADPLFEDVSLLVDPGDRIALVGPNGAGKTTLLRVLSKQLEPATGSVTIPAHIRVALHDQRPARSPLPLREYVAPSHMVQAENRLRELEHAMADGDPAVLREYEQVRAEFDHGGGEGWVTLVEQILRGLGFEEHQLEQPLDTFSGGELTRASLARALAQSPDVLLLDEPTNHLDLQSIDWLQEYLENLRGGLILVSHDRWFIESTCNSVLEIVGGRSRRFKGSFVEYRAQQAMEAVTHQRQLERWQTEMARVQRFVDRFAAGTRARQAQSRVKLLEKLKKDAPQYADLRNRRSLDFRLPKPDRSGAVPFDVRDLTLGFEHRTLLEPCSFVVERGEKIALLGKNGTGKSTLLHTLASFCLPLEDRPNAYQSGEVRVGYGVEARLLSQHDAELIDTMSMLGNMQHVAPKIGRTGAMNLLGLFGFRGADAERQVSSLSGGERRRLLLAMSLTGSANVLLLDEPTNHLDIEGREALEAALADYDGTVILISHDRALVEGVASRIVVLHDEQVQTVVGTFEDARAVMAGEQSAAGAPPPPPVAQKPVSREPQRRTVTAGSSRSKRSGKRRAPSQAGKRVRRPKTIEMELEQLETALGAIQQQMLDPEVYTSPDASATALSEHERLERDIAQRYEELEAALRHHGE